MSSIGKIFVVVNLVLALLVLGAAGSLLSRTDVAKKDVARLEGELAAARTQMDGERNSFFERERLLGAEKQRLQEDKSNLEAVRMNLERTAQRLETDNQQLRDDVTKINATLAALESTFSGTQQRVAELTDQVTRYRGEAADAKAAQNRAEMGRREAETALAASQRAITDLEEQLLAVGAERDTAGRLLEVAKASGFDATSVLAMPRIDATIAEVDDQFGFVILDKGRNADVQRGYTFEIHRDGMYLGRVKVDQVYNEHATARIDLPVPGRKIQRFDHASTYLN